jgi:hypothetical protein
LSKSRFYCLLVNCVPPFFHLILTTHLYIPTSILTCLGTHMPFTHHEYPILNGFTSIGSQTHWPMTNDQPVEPPTAACTSARLLFRAGLAAVRQVVAPLPRIRCGGSYASPYVST